MSPALLGPLDRVLMRRPAPTAAGDGGHHVLVAPPGGGNIGDQAMVEAFLENTTGRVLVVEHSPGTVHLPAGERHRARVVTLAALVYGGGPAHLRDVVRLRRLVAGASSFSVVGADLMDGGYGDRGARTLARTAELAGGHGIDARVLGFSWSERPHPRALRALRHASRSGVRLMLRERLSADRARADGLSEVTEVADMVFSATDVDHAVARRVTGDLGDFVVVNVSGLLHARHDIEESFTGLVRHLRGRGLAVVLLPHVRRPGGDDVEACRLVAGHFADDDGVRFVDGICSPSEVRGLVQHARLVVTGRMHLAILALSARVPAVCLASQGKVEGLMALVGTPELAVEPDEDLGENLVDVTDGALDSRDALVRTVDQRVPALETMSLQNFPTS